MATANIAVEDSCNFVISNGGAQTYHLKASSEVERQRWITALELAKAKAVHMQAESGEVEASVRKREGLLLALADNTVLLKQSETKFIMFQVTYSSCCFEQMILVMISLQPPLSRGRAEAVVTLKSNPHCVR